MNSGGGRFRRWVLPGLAFKAVVIGGGYATGRELAEFFLPSGPRGGLLGLGLAAAIWSGVCALTFLFGRRAAAYDYKSFFGALLGPAWPLFEAAYLLFLVLVLSVFGAAAGAIGAALFGWPPLAGLLALMGCIATATAFGSASVERIFKWVSVLLYGAYAVFVALSLSRFGGQAAAAFAAPVPMDGWALGGLTYASYNAVGAVIILPVTRHMTRDRDALVAGALAGPLAIAPAALFFVCMCAFYPEIGGQTLPSDFLLGRLGAPAFRAVFQVMIFSALLESGSGIVHAVNERLSAAVQRRGGQAIGPRVRLAISLGLLVVSMLVASRFGLTTLIARGYRALAFTLIAVYLAPLLTLGAWRLLRGSRPAAVPA